MEVDFDVIKTCNTAREGEEQLYDIFEIFENSFFNYSRFFRIEKFPLTDEFKSAAAILLYYIRASMYGTIYRCKKKSNSQSYNILLCCSYIYVSAHTEGRAEADIS